LGESAVALTEQSGPADQSRPGKQRETADRAAPSGRTRRTRTRAGTRMAVRAAVLVPLCALLLPLATGSAGAQEDADQGPDPIDFAVLVDQSASLGEQDLAREVQAAALITQAEISQESRATVIGFGSAERSGQSPVDEVCAPTGLNTTGRQKLSKCVQRLLDPDRARIGPGTDFPAAVRQARKRLTENGRDVPRVIFLLTDGKLDVTGSPEYGGDEAERQVTGARQLTEELSTAREQRIQVWPLGFGDEIDRDALRAMAAGGYDSGCAELPDAKPRMRVVGGSADLHRALQETFAAARCAHLEPISPPFRPPGTATVTIPKIATDGSIAVTKHDPAVTVTYLDPNGKEVPLHGSFDGSEFEVSGQDGPVEALRIRDPRPGEWQVRLDAPAGRPAEEATVSVIWQGRIRSSIVLNPSAPRPGEEATVEVRLKTRDGVVIDDPAELAGMRVAVRLSGSGFEPVDRILSDGAGKPPVSGDGRVAFAGTFTVPATADGDLEVTSEAAAPGITADQRPYRTRVTEGTGPVDAKLTLDGEAHPGGSLEGTLVVDNNDDRPHTLRLVLLDRTDEDGSIRLDPTTVTIEPGEHSSVPVTVRLGADVPEGTPGGTLAVLDTTDGDRTLYSDFLRITVTPEPGWWDRWGTAAVIGAALALLLSLAAGLRVRGAILGSSPNGLVLELMQDGRTLDRLEVRRARGRLFCFVVEKGRHGATLRSARAGTAQAHQLRRDSSGVVTVRTPKGVKRTASPGTALPLDGDLELVARLRGPGPGGPGTGRGYGRGTGRGGGRSTAGQGAGAGARPGPGSGPGGSGGYDPNF
jgi:hypothetical protein